MSTAEITRLSFDSAGLRMTPAEFDAIEDWDELYRCELICGVFIVSPFPAPPHVGINEFLGNLLYLYKVEHPASPLDGTLADVYVSTSSDTRRCPDRVIWTGLQRTPKPSRDIPSIVVEIVSPGKAAWQRDYQEKREEYLGLGVTEYWVIDRFARGMSVYRKTDSGFSEVVVGESEIYTTSLLPNFSLSITDLLAAGDRWEESE